MENFFTVKKILSFFIEPFGLILFLFALGLLHLYRNKFTKAKFYISFSFLLLFLFAYPPFSNFLVKGLEDVYPKFEPTDENISYIHVLGNGNNDDMTQPLSSIIGDTSLKRVIEGVELQKRFPNAKLIFSGYEGDTKLANGVVNSRMAQSLGVKESMIIVDSQARDTKDEVLFDKQGMGKKHFIVVTSAMHMLRAVKLFRDNGLDPIPAPTDFKRRNITTIWMKPDIQTLQNSQKAMHEYIGLLWAIFTKSS